MSVDERRTLLIDGAIRAMARDGVANTGTRAIVAEAGMSIGVFHYCFRSKDELVVEVMRTPNQRSFAAAGDLLESSQDPVAVLRGAIDAYWEHVEAHPQERMLLFELTQYSLRNPESRYAAQEQYDTYVEGMARFLGAVATLGSFSWSTDVEVLARYVVANLQGITIQWLVNDDGERARVLLAELGDHLERDGGLAERAV